MTLFYEYSAVLVDFNRQQKEKLPWKDKEQRDGKYDTDGAAAVLPADR